MAIAFTKYVDIVSGVGGAGAVREKEMIGRLFTTNNLLPPQSFVEFSNADQVGEYFGFTSDEYKRAAFYFAWVSKSITSAQKISFVRWVETAVAPRIYGKKGSQTLGAWTSITAGTFTLTLGATTNLIGPVNFSGAVSLAGVAALLQTAIQSESGGAMWSAATVEWDATRQSFNFVGGSAVAADIVVTAGTGGSDIAEQLGWLDPTTILADGSLAETITETLTDSAGASTNFASFLFMHDLTEAEITEASEWADLQNVRYGFMVPVAASTYAAIVAAIDDLGGSAITLSPLATEYPEMIPMIIAAATDYNRPNSVKNYMYQVFDVTPSVTDTSVSDTYDNAGVNYYGRTQTAGQNIDFYQRGYMTGSLTDPLDQNVFFNEVWLKDAAGARIMELLVSLERVSANSTGRSQLMAVLQETIDRALRNGTISVGKPLSTTQKLYIGQITDDDLAWQQVQNIGYWLDCVISSYVTTGGRVEWKATYTLVYSKDDAIRKVDGSHVLI